MDVERPRETAFFIFQNKKSENSNARFRRNLADGDDRETTTERDEGEFIGPNPPGGRRTKNVDDP